MIEPWKTRSSRYLLKRWWMNLREDHVVLPGGYELPEFHVVEYPDWTCVICVRNDGRFVLVEQYRYGVGRASLEFPSGALDPGEDPLTCARRELREETGYEAGVWRELGAVAPEPSKHTNWAHLFVATGAEVVAEPTPDDGEHLETRVLDADELRAAISDGRIIHGIHLSALWLAREQGLLPGF